MTPHLFRSRLFPGEWACCAKTLDPCGSRAYKPLPEAEITYGITPTAAYNSWMECFAPAKEDTNRGNATGTIYNIVNGKTHR